MKHNGGWSFIEVYNLPIGLRNWFFKRLIRYFKEQAEEIENSKK